MSKHPLVVSPTFYAGLEEQFKLYLSQQPPSKPRLGRLARKLKRRQDKKAKHK